VSGIDGRIARDRVGDPRSASAMLSAPCGYVGDAVITMGRERPRGTDLIGDVRSIAAENGMRRHRSPRGRQAQCARPRCCARLGGGTSSP
jgi:hypothetical protein